MIIVLDANVIIAAFAARGLCAELFSYVLSTCKIIGSKELLAECKRTFSRKIKLPKDNVEKIISYLEDQIQIIEPELVKTDICRDPDDLHILGIALRSRANFIVTGDKDLLVLETLNNTKIYTPRQFWTFIQSLTNV